MRDTWTQERVEELRVRWLRGDSAAKIALHFGMSEGAVRHARERFQFPVRTNRAFWNEERDSVLREHWMSHSATAIGAILGVTRNAVIGRGFRLSLPRKTTDQQGKALERMRKAPAPRKIKAQSPRMAAVRAITPTDSNVTPWGVTFTELTRTMCRWPVADDPYGTTSHFCGNGIADGGFSYCPGHARIAYETAGERRQRSEARRQVGAAALQAALPSARAA